MNPLAPQNLSHGLDFDNAKDKSNPRSLVNITPSSVSTRIMVIPDDLFELSTKEVCEKAQGGEELELIRTSWWLEYNRAQKTRTHMNLSNVFVGICGHTMFMNRFVGNSFALLYMITPPVDYQVQQHRVLNLALEKEREILAIDHMKAVYNKDGEMIGEEVDTKLLEVKRKIGEITKNRIMGMPVNRTMQVNQNFNSNAPMGGGPSGPALESMSEEELEKFISLKKKENGLIGESIEVEKVVSIEPKES